MQKKEMHEKLWLMWIVFSREIGMQNNPHDSFSDLETRYSEPHRAYHTFEHVKYCLDELEEVKYLAVNLNAVKFALWYHDVIYNTKAKDNEEQSTVLATKTIKNISLSGSFTQIVSNLIMATKHIEGSTDPDSQLIVDIDLSILGQSEEKFDVYEEQIRKEYEWVQNDAFASGRTAILQSFLERSSIYSTLWFRNKYEAQARKNLVRSIKQLSKR